MRFVKDKNNLFKQMQTNEWVLVLQDSATESYQILDETLDEPKPGWLQPITAIVDRGIVQLCISVIVFGCRLYGIPLPP